MFLRLVKLSQTRWGAAQLLWWTLWRASLALALAPLWAPCHLL
jgi:hypothetical protein